MPINRVEINDFLVFKNSFTADFCNGINVLIGSNGTGKTTLLKVLYWGCEFSNKSVLEDGKNINLKRSKDDPSNSIFILNNYFNRTSFNEMGKGEPEFISDIKLYSSKISNKIPCLEVNVSKDLTQIQMFEIEQNLPKNKALAKWCNMKVAAVFIPAIEMLSHSRGFLALNQERILPFDNTEISIISKAELEPTRVITPNAKKVITKISSIIGGDVEFDGKDFYIKKTNMEIEKIYFPFEASGYRKLGLLWKLLRNGLLENGSVLFWDEPENSLNPEHISDLVDILLELSRNGVQIFIATHSEILASYFAVNRQDDDDVMFTSLYKDDKQIKATTSNRFDLLEPNNLTTEPVKLYEKEIEKGVGGNG